MRGNAIAAGSRTNRVANRESGVSSGFTSMSSPPASAGPQRPIDDISKRRSGSGDNHNVASSADRDKFSTRCISFQGSCSPNQTTPGRMSASHFAHLGTTFPSSCSCSDRAPARDLLDETKIAARAPGDENVAVNLHHLLLGESSARVQVVHVLRDEQELVCVLGQFRDCLMRGVRLRVADAVPPLAIPFPNQFRIARECFRCRQLVPDRDCASSRPFHERSEFRFQPKHPRR